jgi:predicted amidohydrolase
MGSEQWNRLIDAISSANIWTALAFAEREGDHIYMSQALISPAGATVHHRRKLRPSGSERDLFSDGKVEDIKVVETDLGRVGMLQCGE